MEKSAELAGTKVANPCGQRLDDVNPELAKMMEDQWRKMGQDVPEEPVLTVNTAKPALSAGFTM